MTRKYGVNHTYFLTAQVTQKADAAVADAKANFLTAQVTQKCQFVFDPFSPNFLTAQVTQK